MARKYKKKRVYAGMDNRLPQITRRSAEPGQAEREKPQPDMTVMTGYKPRYGEEVIGDGLRPLDHIDGFDVRPGFFRMSGAYQSGNAVSFTVSSHGAKSCTLLLFRPAEAEPYAKIRIPKSYRIGDTYSILVFGLNIAEFEYAYQFDGAYNPAKGKLFNKENVILDPYARAVTGQRNWGDKPEGGKDFVYKARVVKSNFDWGNTKQLNHRFEDLVIYETHVRGFTKDKSSGVQGGGTFEGLRQKIPYLKDLGINAVELMPIFEFDEMENARVVDGVQLYNYWGYNTVSFFSPNTSYAVQEEHNHEGDELKRLILELKQNGIEVILDVVFNHTAEGNEMGPSFCFKGIDNNIYYMLTPDGKYYNFSGCGNVLNCNHPVVRRFITDCLHYWAVEYRVDGFRFDLASILGRDQNGAPMENPPILEELAFDSTLSKMKLIAEAWDAGGLYQVGSFPSWNRWAEWNGRYRDDMRCFLKGDSGSAGRAITRITGSPDMYDPQSRGYSASVNFLTCHDGFTLYDLYSYNEKHNEKNGWDNNDGDNNGHSWNCGCEGPTTDKKVEGLRRRLVKNAFAALMCSRGPAMFLAGDEFCNTQFGNNNAYCQDNIISWLDWNRLEEYQEIHDFVRFMIHFRAEHPVLRKNTKPAECGLPMISIHNGEPYQSYTDFESRLIGIMYAGRNKDETEDDIVFYGMNSYWELLTMHLPEPPVGWHWRVVANTNCEYHDGIDFQANTEVYGPSHVGIAARSTVILVAEKNVPEKEA
ncbi:MAG: alpha-amylase family glycosyl hydrolase [Muribaculaceae bacterium]|nr:alpha-amylase family glycosyl hydrolase [Muribaculaceae bacterium]